MGCNCKATRVINNIYKRYGVRVKTPWVTKFNFNLLKTIEIIFFTLLTLILLPVISIILLGFVLIGKNNINITKLLKYFK